MNQSLDLQAYRDTSYLDQRTPLGLRLSDTYELLTLLDRYEELDTDSSEAARLAELLELFRAALTRRLVLRKPEFTVEQMCLHVMSAMTPLFTEHDAGRLTYVQLLEDQYPQDVDDWADPDPGSNDGPHFRVTTE